MAALHYISRTLLFSKVLPFASVPCTLVHSTVVLPNVLYNKVFSIIIIHRKKEGKRESGRMVVTKSGKTGRESAVFLVTTWRKIEKTLLYSIPQLP